MIVGGGNTDSNIPAINLVDIIDLSETAPHYVPGPDLPGPGKAYVNLLTLPDRTVLAADGAQHNRSDNVLTAAIYDAGRRNVEEHRPRPGRAQLPLDIARPAGRPGRRLRLEPRRQLVRDARLGLQPAVPVPRYATDDHERSGCRDLRRRRSPSARQATSSRHP